MCKAPVTKSQRSPGLRPIKSVELNRILIGGAGASFQNHTSRLDAAAELGRQGWHALGAADHDPKMRIKPRQPAGLGKTRVAAGENDEAAQALGRGNDRALEPVLERKDQRAPDSIGSGPHYKGAHQR